MRDHPFLVFLGIVWFLIAVYVFRRFRELDKDRWPEV